MLAILYELKGQTWYIDVLSKHLEIVLINEGILATTLLIIII